jgi:hypothetical protein
MPTYRIHDTAGDDLGLVEHPAPNLEPGDVVVLADGREALVTARVETQPGPLACASRGSGARAVTGRDGREPLNFIQLTTDDEVHGHA